VQDYKSVFIAVAICATLVNIQKHTSRQYLTSFYEALSQLSYRRHFDNVNVVGVRKSRQMSRDAQLI